jgi:hypothetical protein
MSARRIARLCLEMTLPRWSTHHRRREAMPMHRDYGRQRRGRDSDQQRAGSSRAIAADYPLALR